jgi:hypothetical protein
MTVTAALSKMSKNIEVGQVWEDIDPRAKERFLIVERVDDANVHCHVLTTGKPTRIRKERFKPGHTGYMLVLEANVMRFLRQYIAYYNAKILQP